VPTEPAIKRAIAFVDGQNLFHAAREAFGYTYPNYDPQQLAEAVCQAQGWKLQQVRFYTGVPDAGDQPFWNHFWRAKLAVFGTRRVYTYARPLRYSNRRVTLPDGTVHTYLAGHEKGIDVRLALDVLALGVDGTYDVAVLFSQDQDLSELGDDIRRIVRRADRWIKLACAYPNSPTSRNRRGINGTDWIKIDRATYDKCLDPNDYRPKKPSP
jgi:uncharacterized LabA/DUF88 family protein